MRLGEFAQREPIDELAAKTLNALWASRFDGGARFHVEGPGRSWRAHDLLSAYFDPNLSARGRRYLRDGFRNTPRRARRLAQWVLGTALASGPGLRWTSRPAFRVESASDMTHLLVVPGNRRFRLLDFSRGCAVVVGKHGYGSESLSVERQTRLERPADFMVPVLDSDPEGGWLEEPLLEGWPLPRAPRSHDQAGSLRWASSAVETWAEPAAESQDAVTYLSALLETLREDLRRAHERFPELPEVPTGWLERLSQWAEAASSVELLPSHGDLQAGNLWLDADRARVLILDWESCALRSRGYDRRVQELHTRSPVGVGARITTALREAGSERAHLATFLLEDWVWFLNEALDVPGSFCPGGLATLHRELSECVVRGAHEVGS